MSIYLFHWRDLRSFGLADEFGYPNSAVVVQQPLNYLPAVGDFDFLLGGFTQSHAFGCFLFAGL
jgi:hypothetical protein